MADNEEFDLDEFNLDEFNFDEFNIDPENVKDDRTPVTAVKDSAISTFRSTLTDRNAIRRAMEKSLPDEYASTFEAYDKAADLKDQVKEAMEPVAAQSKQLLRNNKKLVEKFLPEKFAKRLSDWSEGDADSGGYENIDPREAEIGASLADIFKVNKEQDQAERQADQEVETERFAIKEEADTKRHGTQLGVLESIRSSISRQIDYQDQVLSKYQQKHLELTYRQLYSLQDILELNKRRAETETDSYAKIIKNTGLPETQKIRAFEEAKREAAQQVRAEMVTGAADYVKGLGGRLTNNVIKNSQRKLLDMLGTANDMAGMGEQMGSPMEMLGMILGSEGGNKVLDTIIERGLKMTGQDAEDSTVREMASRFQRIIAEAPERLAAWSQTASGRTGFFGFIEDLLKEQTDGWSRPDTYALDQVADADEAATFTNRVARSITDVIPGYLAQQLHQLRLIVSGGEPVDRIEYDPSTGTFESVDKKQRGIEERLFSRVAPAYQQASERTAQDLLRSADVSDEQREEFQAFLYDHFSRGKAGDIDTLSRAVGKSSYVSEGNRATLSDILKDNVFDSEGKHLKGRYFDDKLTETFKNIQGLRETLPDMVERVRELDRAGYRSDLIELGLLRQDGRIDHDVVAQYLRKRPNEKEMTDDTLATRVASGPRNLVDDARLVRSRPQDTYTDLEERGADPFGYRSQTQGPEEKETQTLNYLSQLLDGQSQQTEYLDLMVDRLSTADGSQGSSGDAWASVIERQTDTLKQAILECCVKTEAQEHTELLRQILAIIPEAAVITSGDPTATAQVRRSLMDRVAGATKTGADMLKSYYENAFSLMGKGVTGVTTLAKPWMESGAGLVRSLGERLIKGKEAAQDFYVKGSERIAIEYNKLMAGEYFDEDGKPLLSKEDLENAVGAIRDKAGNIVVSAEDLAKGLYTRAGGEGVAAKGMRWLESYYKALYKGASGIANLIPPTIKWGIETTKGLLNRQVDLYVLPDLETPRLKADLLKKGFYRSKTTGKPIYTYAEIDGTIENQEGHVVLSADELEKVVDRRGKPIRSITDKAIDLVKGYYGTIWKGVRKAGELAGGIAGGIRDRLTGAAKGRTGETLEDAQRTQSYWEEQLDILRRLDRHITGGPPIVDVPDHPAPIPGQLALPPPPGYDGPQDADFTPSSPSGPDLKSRMTDAGAAVKDTATSVADAVRTRTSGLRERAGDLADRAKTKAQGLSEQGQEAGEGIKDKLSGMLGGLKDKFSNFMKKEDQEDEHEEKQTGLLSKLTSFTEKRAESLNEMQTKQAESQAQMTKTLKAIEENTEKDEVRSGSWQERMAKRKEGRGEGGDQEDAPELGPQSKALGYEKKSFMDIVLGPFGSIVSKFGEYIGSFGSIIGSVVGALGGGALLNKAKNMLGFGGGDADDLMDGRDGRNKPPAKKGGLWGKLKSAGKWVGNAAWNVGKFAVTRALPAVAIGGAKLIGAGAAALGSVLSAPVVLGAAAVAGVAYGGYKLYQYATTYRPRVLDKLRFAQYGLDIGGEENRKLVLPLEEYLEDHLSWDQGRPKIDYDPEDSTLAELLGLNGESETMDGEVAIRWFQERFMPVWGAHRGILHNVFNDEKSLSDIDDLKVHQKRGFLENLRSAVSGSVFEVGASPFVGRGLDFTKDQVEAMHAWAVEQFKEDASDKATVPEPQASSEDMESLGGSTSRSTSQTPTEAARGAPGRSRGGQSSYWGVGGTQELLQSVPQSRGSEPYVLEILRYKQTREATFSNVKLIHRGTGDSVFEFKMLERPGPDTKEPNQRKRIPEGTYKLKWQTRTGLAGVRPHLPVPWLYGSGVPEDRHIYIHNGNYPRQTDGCLLCGKDEVGTMVTSSVDTLNRLKTELQAIGIENVTVSISSRYQAGQKPPKDETPSTMQVAQAPQGETWSEEETLRRAMSYRPRGGESPDGRGQSPLEAGNQATRKEQSVLDTMPTEWVNKDDEAATLEALRTKYPEKPDRELETLRDIELTRLTRKRQLEWLDENGVSVAAAQAAGKLAGAPTSTSTQPTVRSYGPIQDEVQPAVYRPQQPALSEKPAPARSADAEQEREVQETREQERQAQAQVAMRERVVSEKRVEQEHRGTREAAARIESVLSEQLRTQQRMSDNLDKLVLLAEGRFEQATEKTATEYLTKRGYRPPRRTAKDPFKPVVDLSN